ncbi:oligopeptide transport system ATP-binding protein [Butyrivibrio sp. ob235]|uniref:ABC transporter ATP-binding protein n=1 Tax=Butyrivibrio sp. ob235 TaxID=1761780 RepID=UPI0008AAADA9|nr:ATP-binding cassette domain-containing protein [Butyrivibrio sp. ob235]SEK80504.1 oligopeptide transport system ATP-binding protein [Butyrivibrio sp. ob235]
MENTTLLEVKNLKQYFKSGKTTVKAVDDVSFKIKKGSTFGLVGESGSGKSTIGRAIIRLYDPTEGKVILGGKEVSGKMTAEKKKYLTSKMQMIFQDPMASLNPRKKVIDIVAEGLDSNHLCKSKKEREEKVYAMLERVGLNHEQAGRYPHMFSGGQRQRIGIARAMIMEPELIIADECISALDVSIQAQVVNIMKDLQKERGLTYLFIAHDLAMVKYISDYIGVIHLGHFVEMGTKEEIFEHPVHPYTKSLLSAIPEPNPLTEPTKKLVTYDKAKEKVDYSKGTAYYLSENHMVLGTDEEVARWMAV